MQVRWVSFSQLGVNPTLVHRLTNMNITDATAIQEKVGIGIVP